MSEETPYNMLNGLVQGFTGYALLALSLLLPIMAGLGFNFSMGIGAIAGQLGLIMALNWELSGLIGILVAVAFASLFAIFAGVLTGMVLDKAKGQEMITSYFMGLIGNGVNQFICLGLVGSIISVSSTKLLLGSGEGLKTNIDLKGSLFQALDGLLEIKFFILLIIIGIVMLVLTVYRVKKNDANYDKMKYTIMIIASSLLICISGIIMFVDSLPTDIKKLSKIEFPIITGAVICGVVVYHGMIHHTKLGKHLTRLSIDQQSITDSNSLNSKLRITAITISTLLAAWGQVVLLQNTGFISTYGSHSGITMISVLALIAGGASFRKASITNALLGVILLQGFNLIAMPVISDELFGNNTEIFRNLFFNGVIVYALVKTWGEKKKGEILE
jgi:simple sugar transport system permease protein